MLLILLFFILAAFVIFTATAAPGAHQAENAQEQEAVGDEEVIIEIPDCQELSANKKADYAGQHQKGAEDPGCPAQVRNNGCQFHCRCFWF